ncbi:uncharacterized protein EDB93DRAFT_1256157 [Suillus bovinus]|uniref:uncharacterized protein n=1 Tax=Suillus bovinus TaxID=48563 RepID=UPI001B876292|nr:uncharacterized protein EDB93DRAFT_1256157 [Suillus bovinus]KAG2129685.1 hypothetical protein EDB93DRAFT_1256157 [Suillus bovinus]
MNYYIAQERAIRQVVTLFDNIEDLVCKNDRRCDTGDDDENTSDQNWLQIRYITFTNSLHWFFKKALELEYDNYLHMLKSFQQGANGAQGDDTLKLKTLISEWVNCWFKPDPPVDPDNKNSCGFTNNACTSLNPPEMVFNGYIITDLSFLAFLYKKYTANPDDLEEGLFKGKILVQSYKVVFTSPSSAKDIDGDGDGTDIIQNNRRAQKSSCRLKVKKHVAQIIHMEKVTPHSITYIVRFALFSVTSWWSINGDFDYVQFWQMVTLTSYPYPDLTLVILVILAFPFALYLSLQQSQYIWPDPFADEAYPCSVPPPD